MLIKFNNYLLIDRIYKYNQRICYIVWRKAFLINSANSIDLIISFYINKDVFYILFDMENQYFSIPVPKNKSIGDSGIIKENYYNFIKEYYVKFSSKYKLINKINCTF